MATFVRQFSRSLFQVSRRAPAKRKCNSQLNYTPRCQPFSSRRSRRRQEEDEEESKERALRPWPLAPRRPFTIEDFTPEGRATFEALSKDDQAAQLAEINEDLDTLYSPETRAELASEARALSDDIARNHGVHFARHKPKPHQMELWGVDEVDNLSRIEDEDTEPQETDISSVAHAEIELHREIREYNRIIAWDLPLLQSMTNSLLYYAGSGLTTTFLPEFAKPFHPPPLTSPLRFRYTTYMGESHPAARKVVVQFCTKDLPSLTEAQRIKLVKLVGVRYNPDTDMVHMSCEKFENPAQNKRHLGDLVQELIAVAKDDKDMFEDVPLDFRHHRPKKAPEFPKEWLDGAGRRQELALARREAKLLTDEREVVDGSLVVEEYVNAAPFGGLGQVLQRPTSAPPRRRPAPDSWAKNQRLAGIR